MLIHLCGFLHGHLVCLNVSSIMLGILNLHRITQTPIRVRCTVITPGLLNKVTHFDNLIIELVHDLSLQSLHKVAYLHNYNPSSITCSSIRSTVRSQFIHDHIIKHYINQPVYIHNIRLPHNNLQQEAKAFHFPPSTLSLYRRNHRQTLRSWKKCTRATML